ncbi:segmentation protein cap'n'collar isoform X2 [Phymastichus coffea]|uniref:segmentation protein cap'n'collar isoform X2 n=1 Tax=Phymastichus coffea TaxID=108790 RepID=UPI00273CAE2D|nr:segmentation protein cap'n'collar isoform X2 [Phymastichus coffea]
MNVIHPQYHHPHARSFQRGMPLVRPMGMEHHQRWSDMFMSGGEPFAHPGPVNSLHQSHLNYTVHHSHHHHQPYGDVTAPPPRHALMSNATIPPPVGDLNSTGTYHNTGNLGSAVATSMNLTNNGESLSADGVTPFKPEPSDMMSSYYPNPTNDTVNQTDIPFSFLDDPISWADDSFGVGFNNVTDGMAYGANSTSAGGGGGGSASSAGPTASMIPVAGSTQSPNDDGRMETSSDSAVSSMGSERVPSLSDGGEWMETGSNSSHTQADTHYSMDYTGKYRMPYDCGYSLAPGAGRRANGANCQQSAAERAGLAPVAQKKHHMFGKRCFQEQQGPMTPGAAAPPSKYDYDAAQNVAVAGPPGQAYSGPIEGAAGPQPEIKYSCSVDFSRHQSARSSLEHVQHNHTYNLPAESSGALQRPMSRDKKGEFPLRARASLPSDRSPNALVAARKTEADEHMTRDEKRARALNVPISVNDIINLPMDEFNERLSKYDLNDNQLGLIRDIRRRGKNKVAAQNCRKRKLDQINSLSDEVREMRSRKMRLKNDREYMLQEVARVKEKFGQLYRHVLHSLRDPAGRPYDPREYSLQLSAEGNVVLVPKSNHSTHYGFPLKKPDQQ